MANSLENKEAVLTGKNSAAEDSWFLNNKAADAMILAVTLVMALLHLVYSQVAFMPVESYRTMHLCFSMAIAMLLLVRGSNSKVVRVLNFTGAVLIMFCFFYIVTNIEALRLRAWMNTDLDLIVGVLLIVFAYYTAFKNFGWVLPAVAFLVMIYPFFGKYMPGALQTTSYSLEQTIANLSIGLSGGVYSVMSTSADYIFLFTVLGGVMSAVGVQKLFYEIGKLLFGRFRSGSAQITCLNTALIGTVVGSSIANVSISGPYCLKGMKDDGYSDVSAAAILAASANGGQILPPVMGVVAFAISGYAGIPYWTICKMALIPALLYYVCIMLYAYLNARKDPVIRNRSVEKPVINYDLLKWKLHSFLLPFATIIYFLAKGSSVTRTAFYAIMVTIVCGLLTKKEYRPSVKDIVMGISSGAIDGAKMACCCACIGTLVTTFDISGLSVKLAASIQALGGGALFLVILIIYIISTIAGMCGVAAAAYFTIAAFSVSVLTKMGISYNVAHFFSAYPSFFSTLTPPVALVSLVASRLAGSKYGKTAIESCKVAFTGFIMPFLLCYTPAICLATDMSSIWAWLDVVTIIFTMLCVQVVFCKYLLQNMNVVELVAGIAGVTMLLLFCGEKYLFLLVGGYVGCLIMIASQIVRYFRGKKASGYSAA